MRYFSHEPAPPLGDFVHNFWDCIDAPSHPKERILPSGTIELVVNLREDEFGFMTQKSRSVTGDFRVLSSRERMQVRLLSIRRNMPQ